MIIGRGLIGSLFIEYEREDTVFFASGVSNSLEIRTEEFLREETLIRKTIEDNPDKIFVYFSTCSIYDSSKTGSDYVLHKLKMEQIVKNTSRKYLILRVSNAVGKGGNPNLLMNYLLRSIRNNATINVHTKATRNLIDADDIDDPFREDDYDGFLARRLGDVIAAIEAVTGKNVSVSGARV